MDSVHASEVGNPAYPPLMKFKALLLQTWHQLSDPQLESQLARDLLFRHFVGMGISDEVPHNTVFVRFRAILRQQDLFEPLFNEINRQLTEHSIIKFGQIIPIDTVAVYADRAYAGKKHDAWLQANGIDNRIIARAYRNTPLPNAKKERNRLHSSVRSTVERVFGALKLHLGLAKTKYVGLARNQVQLCLVAMAYNLKRAVKINALCTG